MDTNFFNKKQINKIQKKLNYRFRNKKLANKAFTHSSFAYDQNLASNERLEFLGDSVLQLCTTRYLFDNFSLPEGKLSKMRAFIVSTKNLSDAIKNTGLVEYLKIKNQPQRMQSVEADLFESIVGAIYLDGGYKNACKFIKKILKFSKNSFLELESDSRDYKTQLQELVQSKNLGQFSYSTKRISGPSHNPRFGSKLILSNKVLAKGDGYSKKEAETNAAKKALVKLNKAIDSVEKRKDKK